MGTRLDMVGVGGLWTGDGHGEGVGVGGLWTGDGHGEGGNWAQH